MPDWVQVLLTTAVVGLALLVLYWLYLRFVDYAALRPSHFVELAEELRELRPQVVEFAKSGDPDEDEFPSFETRRGVLVQWCACETESTYLHLWAVSSDNRSPRVSALLAAFVADRLGVAFHETHLTTSRRGYTMLMSDCSDEAHRGLMSRPIELPTHSEHGELMARLEELVARLPRDEDDEDEDEDNPDAK